MWSWQNPTRLPSWAQGNPTSSGVGQDKWEHADLWSICGLRPAFWTPYASFHLSVEWRERMERLRRGHRRGQRISCKSNKAGREDFTAFAAVCVAFTGIAGLLLALFCQCQWLSISFKVHGIQDCTRFPPNHSRAASPINEHAAMTFRKNITRLKAIFLYAVSLTFIWHLILFLLKQELIS